MRGLERNVSKRYATAREMAADMERCVGVASPMEIGDWVDQLAGGELAERATILAQIEAPPHASSEPTLKTAAFPKSRTLGGAPAPQTPTATQTAQTPTEVEVRSETSHVVETPPPAVASKRGRPSVTALAAVGAGLAAVVITLGGRPAVQPPPRAVTADSPPDAHGALAATPPAPPSSPSDGPAAAPADAAGAPPPVVPKLEPSIAPAAAGSAARARERPLRKATRNCDPPYVLDAAGHHRYKPECL
jgi:serine/threonine-protein kinase